jgi:hypothetical protein
MMPEKLLALFLALLGMLFLSSCVNAEPTPELAFEQVIYAIEQKDIARLDALMAPDFTGTQTRRTFLSWAQSSFSKPSTVRFNIVSQEARIDGATATLRTVMGVASGPGFLPSHAHRLQVDTQWVHTIDGWKVRVAQWRRL